MASLTVLKGNNPGQVLKLEGMEEFTVGRGPECQIHIPNNAVSRQHAKITRSKNGYHVEDMLSRNGTLLNNQPVTQRTQLKNNDKIKICDWMFTFHDDRADDGSGDIVLGDEDPSSPSTVHASVGRISAQQLLETQSNEKLKVLLEISGALGRALDQEALLQQIADSLFGIYKQADRCFIILRDAQTGALKPRIIKTRRANAETNARFSKTIVKQCLESGQSLLFEDAQSGGQMVLSASIAEFRIRSVMCAPLLNRDDAAFGLIQLDSQDRNKTFTEDDLRLLKGVANQAAMALENARLQQVQIEAAVRKEEEALAQQVQKSFLPKHVPDIPGYQFFAYYQPAKNVGGDYYDFIRCTEGSLGVLLGDVAGKGMPAALLMAKLSAEARYCMLTHQTDLARAAGELNEQLLAAGMMDRFVTLAGSQLDPKKGIASFVNAGHMPPLIYRGDRRVIEDAISNDQSGFALGIMDGTNYECVSTELRPGDCVILYTDGVTDAIDINGATFGPARLRQAILGDGGTEAEGNTPEQIGQRIIDSVQNHATGQYQNDDIALVCFGRLPDAGTSSSNAGQVVSASGPATQSMKRTQLAAD